MRELKNPSGSTVLVGKNRNPFAVWFLSIITLGIYHFYWYYKVNAEIGVHEPLVKTNPAVSLLAISPLAVVTLFISALVSMYNTAVRIQRMEVADDLQNQISPLVTVILLFLVGIGYYFQIQEHLNAHWDRHQLVSAGRLPESLPDRAPVAFAAPPQVA